MRSLARFALFALVSTALVGDIAHAARRPGAEPVITIEEALDSAEHLLDVGGDASQTSERLHKTRGLTKDELARLELIDARCALLSGANAVAEKIFARRSKAEPDDARLAEWYARALDGNGKGDAALPIFKTLADGGKLQNGDSYWALAQLERKNGQAKRALEHAKQALQHPIVFQSDALDKEIHAFIAELAKAK